MCMGVNGVHYPEESGRELHAVYALLSLTHNRRIRLEVAVPDSDPHIPSLVEVWGGINWHERETYDMFGIKFEGHPDLRRILMWDGYPFFPLRKEFPLAGIDTPLPDAEITAETGVRLIAAPMAGGPFVASSGEINLTEAEPRAKDESWNERRGKPEA